MSDRTPWSEDELEAAVIAYIDMRTKLEAGVKVSKKQYYRELSAKFGRSEKSYEYRMQNISYVYSLMGRSWVAGLKPAKNVGASNVKIIERLIQEQEELTGVLGAEFEAKVLELRQKKNLAEPTVSEPPSKNQISVTRFARDPNVKAWVLENAGGRCECCCSPAPFQLETGQPYLEVHHVKQLAEGGSDSVSNTVALCPNCHRELHYGLDKLALKEKLYGAIGRLKPE